MTKSFDEFEKYIDSPEMETLKDSVYQTAYEAEKKRREVNGEEVDKFTTSVLIRDRATAAVSRLELRKYHEWLND